MKPLSAPTINTDALASGAILPMMLPVAFDCAITAGTIAALNTDALNAIVNARAITVFLNMSFPIIYERSDTALVKEFITHTYAFLNALLSSPCYPVTQGILSVSTLHTQNKTE
ncbi:MULTISPECIES: hypothetical protein [Janthinobacterium]|uniref:hypothetical protein n=1 Tax=Janthinobacterium TaxID=29580 RepID=UPI00186B3BE0|nr:MULTISPECIES: hypothetical protein [Janthinobacterium]MCX7291835.1 hypothetical protein [Janthinobacterium sp.]MED5598157.1 hypothetical protein [Janthinobacterium sp. P210006]